MEDVPLTPVFALGPKALILRCWMIGLPGFDVMAMLWKENTDDPETPWHAVLRTRSHAPGSGADPHPDDRKSIFTASRAEGETWEEFGARFETAVDELAATYKSVEPKCHIWAPRLNATTDEFTTLLAKQPFAHSTVIAKESETIQ